jgi:hypothetical protein
MDMGINIKTYKHVILTIFLQPCQIFFDDIFVIKKISYKFA